MKKEYIITVLDSRLQSKIVEKNIRYNKLLKFFIEQHRLENIQQKPDIKSSTSNPISEIHCYNCGKKGHYKSDCKEKTIDKTSGNEKGDPMRQVLPK